jgi:hypothetical protein
MRNQYIINYYERIRWFRKHWSYLIKKFLLRYFSLILKIISTPISNKTLFLEWYYCIINSQLYKVKPTERRHGKTPKILSPSWRHHLRDPSPTPPLRSENIQTRPQLQYHPQPTKQIQHPGLVPRVPRQPRKRNHHLLRYQLLIKTNNINPTVSSFTFYWLDDAR